MPRYIDDDDIKNAIEGVTRNYLSTLSTTDTIDSVTAKWLYKRLKTLVDEMPTADVRENVHAKWLPYEFGNERWHKCSACGKADEYINERGLEAVRKFCPHCGARMGERRENG